MFGYICDYSNQIVLGNISGYLVILLYLVILVKPWLIIFWLLNQIKKNQIKLNQIIKSNQTK